MWLRLVLAAAFYGIASMAAAQSFDCAKARTRVEKMVCADRAIAELDEYLGRYHAAARAEITGAEACLQSDLQERLAILAKDRSATFRARGYAATNSKGQLFFEPGRCVFLHRLPAAHGEPVVQDAEQQMEQVRRKVVSQGTVCADPDRPCPGFKANELSFSIATPFKFDRGRDKSQPFYAVILKSAPICSLADAERMRAQKVFPRAKVFLHRYFCEDFGDKVTYANVNEKSGFVAVYAGDSAAAAELSLALAKASGYPDANIRRLEVIVVYQIE